MLQRIKLFRSWTMHTNLGAIQEAVDSESDFIKHRNCLMKNRRFADLDD